MHAQVLAALQDLQLISAQSLKLTLSRYVGVGSETETPMKAPILTDTPKPPKCCCCPGMDNCCCDKK